jgi:hypothetical protein
MPSSFNPSYQRTGFILNEDPKQTIIMEDLPLFHDKNEKQHQIFKAIVIFALITIMTTTVFQAVALGYFVVETRERFNMLMTDFRNITQDMDHISRCITFFTKC